MEALTIYLARWRLDVRRHKVCDSAMTVSVDMSVEGVLLF